MTMETKAGMVTRREVFESSKNKKIIICDRRSVMRERTDKPVRLVFCCQKAISDWKAKNSKRR
jgi:hypothetical protein